MSTFGRNTYCVSYTLNNSKSSIASNVCHHPHLANPARPYQRNKSRAETHLDNSDTSKMGAWDQDNHNPASSTCRSTNTYSTLDRPTLLHVTQRRHPRRILLAIVQSVISRRYWLRNLCSSSLIQRFASMFRLRRHNIP